MVSQICRDAAEAIVKSHKSDRANLKTEVDTAIRELQEMRKGLQRLSKGGKVSQQDLLKAAENRIQYEKWAALEKRRSVALQFEATRRQKDLVDGWRTAPSAKQRMSYNDMLNGFAFGTEHGAEGVRLGVEMRTNAQFQNIWNAAEQRAADRVGIENIRAKFKGEAMAKFQDDLETEWLEIELGDEGNPGSTGDPVARALAEEHVKSKQWADAELRRLGVDRGVLDDHGARQTHSPTKIAKDGRESWVSYLMEEDRLDWGRMLDGVEPTDVKKREYLNSAFDGVTGAKYRQRLTDDGNTISANNAPSRQLHFNKASNHKARKEYRTKYGRNTFYEAARSDAQMNARMIEMVKALGPKPNKGWASLIKTIEDKIKNDIDPKDMGKKWWAKQDPAEVPEILKRHRDEVNTSFKTGQPLRRAEQAIRWLDGSMMEVESELMARYGRLGRMTQTVSKLDLTTITAIMGDPSTVAGRIYQTGGGMDEFAAFMANSIPSKTRNDKWNAIGLGHGFELMPEDLSRHLHEMAGDQDKIYDMLQKVMRMGMLQKATDNMRLGHKIAIMGSLGARANDPTFNFRTDLNGRQQTMFRRFGIGADEWDAWKSGLTEVDEGVWRIDSTLFNEIPDAKLEKVAGKRMAEAKADYKVWLKNHKKKWDDKSWNGRRRAVLEDTRQELTTRYDLMIQDEDAHGVLMASARVMDFMRGGAKRGTLQAEAASTIMQFKGWGMEKIEKAYGRAIYSHDNTTTASAFTVYMTLSAMSGIATHTAYNIAKGRDPLHGLDFEENPIESTLKVLARGGFGPIVMDMILNHQSPYGSASRAENLVGPLIGESMEGVQLITKALQGDTKARDKLPKWLKDNTPFADLIDFRQLISDPTTAWLKEVVK